MITSVQRTAMILAAERFDQPDQHAAQHRARDVADAAEHRRGEGAQPGGVADDEARVVVVEAEDQPGRAGERRAEEEGDDDDPVDIDAHHARRFLILRGRLHRLAHLGAAHEDNGAPTISTIETPQSSTSRRRSTASPISQRDIAASGWR